MSNQNSTEDDICSEEGCSCPIIDVVVDGDPYCSAHDPDGGREKMSDRGKKGGAEKDYNIPPEELPGSLESFADFKSLISQVALKVASGRVKPKVGNTLSRLAKSWVKLAEGEISTDRLETIREKQEELQEAVQEQRRTADAKPWE